MDPSLDFGAKIGRTCQLFDTEGVSHRCNLTKVLQEPGGKLLIRDLCKWQKRATGVSDLNASESTKKYDPAEAAIMHGKAPEETCLLKLQSYTQPDATS
jgi:hypothetical protein